MARIMEGRAGLVTAAGSGIGRASAVMFARAGASVIVSDIDDEAGSETVRLIVEGGGVASFVHADVSDEAVVEALVGAVVDRYGRLDWAHNNAALGTRAMPLAAMKRSAWDRCLAVTLTGTMLCLKYEIAQMLGQGSGGAIVNTASLSGLTGTPNQSAYVAAKFGVIGLTKTAAIENAVHGIRVNAICPGATATPAVAAWEVGDPAGYRAALDAIPVGAMAAPDDQARTAVWLCSPWAAHITGVSLPVDGGEMAGH